MGSGYSLLASICAHLAIHAALSLTPAQDAARVVAAKVATGWLKLTLLASLPEPEPAKQSVPGCGSGVDGPCRID